MKHNTAKRLVPLLFMGFLLAIVSTAHAGQGPKELGQNRIAWPYKLDGPQYRFLYGLDNWGQSPFSACGVGLAWVAFCHAANCTAHLDRTSE